MKYSIKMYWIIVQYFLFNGTLGYEDELELQGRTKWIWQNNKSSHPPSQTSSEPQKARQSPPSPLMTGATDYFKW